MPRRVVVIGAGGVGGWLIRGLAPMLEFKDPGSMLVVVDGDNFEPKNLERQDFQIYGNKAQVRFEELQPAYTQTFIIPRPFWVVAETLPEQKDDQDEGGFLAIHDLLQENDIVFVVVDNFAARKIVFDAAREYTNIDVLTGGNDDQFYGSIYHYQRRDGREMTDHPADYHDELDTPPDRNPGELSCQERAELEGGTQLLASNMAVAAFLLARAHLLITEAEGMGKASEIMFDLEQGISLAYDRTAEPVPAALTRR